MSDFNFIISAYLFILLKSVKLEYLFIFTNQTTTSFFDTYLTIKHNLNILTLLYCITIK